MAVKSDPLIDAHVSRRVFLRNGARAAALAGLGALSGALAHRAAGQNTVWQIDWSLCVHCDRCATDCVMPQSAVKCVHAHAICGYCKLCTGYFVPEKIELTSGAENLMCPTDAIRRSFVEDPYFQYVVEEDLCIGCAKCVDGCNRFGNGSLFLQVRHDRCLNCNECSIARVCPGGAFRRVAMSQPYLIKTVPHSA